MFFCQHPKKISDRKIFKKIGHMVCISIGPKLSNTLFPFGKNVQWGEFRRAKCGSGFEKKLPLKMLKKSQNKTKEFWSSFKSALLHFRVVLKQFILVCFPKIYLKKVAPRVSTTGRSPFENVQVAAFLNGFPKGSNNLFGQC